AGQPYCRSGWTNVPDVGSQYANFLGLSALGPDDVWMVGTSGTAPPALAEHFDGTAWTTVPVVQQFNTYLNGVAAVAPDDVWAVGDGASYSDPSVILHWNGSYWATVSNPSSGQLYGITATSANDVWAVGNESGKALVEHWDGVAWTATVLTEKLYLYAV